MTCSISSSTSTVQLAIGLVLAVALCSCAGRGGAVGSAIPVGASRLRVAVFPLENLSSGPIPAREVSERLDLAIAGAGPIELVTGQRVAEFLAKNRIRWTAGVDRHVSVAARHDLEVDAILLATVELYREGETPAFGVTLRLVSTGEVPRILWMDGRSRTGADSPGMLGLGVIRDMHDLQQDVLRDLRASLEAYLRSGDGKRPCPEERRFRPEVAYRSPALDAEQRYSVAVLPFVNNTPNSAAGEIVALQMVRQLHAAGFEVLDPGAVRSAMIGYRVILQGGASLDTARIMTGALEVNIVLTGTVRQMPAGASPSGAATAAFSVTAIDGKTNRLVWESSTASRGDAGVVLFDRGLIRTAPELVCRMARQVAGELSAGR